MGCRSRVPGGAPSEVRAWVRFGAQHTRVEAELCRSTELAAGIEFVVRDKACRCWVWGKAVQIIASGSAPRPQ